MCYTGEVKTRRKCMAGKEDKCCIEVMGEMTMERSAAFSMLYYPLIGKDAAVLYHTLMAIATRSRKIKNHLLIEKSVDYLLH